MGEGHKVTFDFLARTENEAAIELLTAALECPSAPTRQEAIRALLTRNQPSGHRAVIRLLPILNERERAVVRERPERLVFALRDGLRAADGRSVSAACNTILSFQLYQAVPELVSALLTGPSATASLLADTLLKTTEQFYAASGDARHGSDSGKHEDLRNRITASLEEAVRKFHRHRQTQAIEALLLIARQKNVTLRHVLGCPDESSHGPMLELLGASPRGGVMRFLLGFLKDPQSPRAVLTVLASRTDAKFVKHLLHTIGSRPAKTVAETAARINSFAWAEPGHPVFARLDGAAQASAVELLMSSGMERARVFPVLGRLLLEGQPEGRRAAARAMAQFPGDEASALVVRAVVDEDPEVRASLLAQLRPRQIPGAMSLLIRMVGSPQPAIRKALRESLPEFTFERFLAGFDNLPEEVRPAVGHLVKKIDETCVSRLSAEVDRLSPVRRRRAVLAADAMGLVAELESAVIARLSDDDHMVRVAAARALADCKSAPSWEALREALLDRSVVVQEAAGSSLERIGQALSCGVSEAKSLDEVLA